MKITITPLKKPEQKPELQFGFLYWHECIVSKVHIRDDKVGPGGIEPPPHPPHGRTLPLCYGPMAKLYTKLFIKQKNFLDF